MRPSNLHCPFTWQKRCPMVEDRVLYVPDFYPDLDSWTFPGWKSLFGNVHPVIIEYCSGNGLWIAEKAKAHPEWNWVAVERDFERVRKIWSKIKNYDLTNLIVVSGEAHTFTRTYIPAKSCSEVFINFPDPWPKQKHRKHRLIQKPFIDELARILLAGATVTMTTDHVGYSKQIIDVFSACEKFRSHFAPEHFVTDWPEYGNSYFDALWRSKGCQVRYMQFQVLS